MVCVTVNDATNNVQLSNVDFYYSQNGGSETSELVDADGKLCLEQILSETILEFRVEKVGYEKETDSRVINGHVLDWFIVLNPLVSSLLL